MQQPEQHIERKGPALKAAYTSEGLATPALQGFLRSCHARIDDLQQQKTSKGTWVIYKAIKPGKLANALLPTIITKALQSLPMNKTMRWGNHAMEFIRPIHWVVMLHGEKTIAANILGKMVGNITYGHRFLAPQAITLTTPLDYIPLLADKGKVIADLPQRKEIIRKQINCCAQTVKGSVVIDEKLLDEVAGLVEWPVALLCNFDAAFLQVPEEVLIASMEHHQKSFAIRNEQGQLLPHFITVSNIISHQPQRVIHGNETVMRARLADAKFFYTSDNRHPLTVFLTRLRTVSFHNKLGSLYDKAQRISTLASHIAALLNANTEQAAQAGLLCKADLTSDMVGEFPGLQGVMGSYYALHHHEDSHVAQAIREHYQPRFADDAIPHSDVGYCVALADKIDSLVGIFGIKQVPTGDKDPFALRRAAIGIIRIVLEKQLVLDLHNLFTFANELYNNRLSNENLLPELLAFVFERLRAWYKEQNVRYDVFNAVYTKKRHDLIDVDRRITAMTEFAHLSQAQPLAETNKRVKNILSKNKLSTQYTAIDEDLLKEHDEIILWQEINAKQRLVTQACRQQQYQQALTYLAELNKPIDDFFNNVMVMVEDQALRNNRLLLLQQLRDLFLHVADISELQS
ncbi:MAG: glycine--tRNA ligase subunit beta [Gammaproteobacteria bacterium]|nr:glycine--tRNA ligase subunit beta [Gammaproteobacteria bacterium]